MPQKIESTDPCSKVREALVSRFKGIPDVHYGDDTHWASEDGQAGLSDWTLTGTTGAGVSIKVRAGKIIE